MKRIGLLLFALIGMTLLESCYGCGGGQSESFNWKDLSLVVKKKNLNSQLLDGQKIRFDSVEFFFKIDKEYISFIPTQLFSSSSSLYACDPAPPMSNQRVSEVLISSNNTYITNSKNFNSSTNLAEIFTGSYNSTIEQFVSNQPLYDDFYFTIAHPPIGNQQHEFTFSIKLDDGRVFDKKVTLVITP